MNIEYFSTFEEYEKWLMFTEYNVEIQSIFCDEEGCIVKYIARERCD